jgi:hypothetical protein
VVVLLLVVGETVVLLLLVVGETVVLDELVVDELDSVVEAEELVMVV